MKYRISKRDDDGRAFTYGVVLPDSFYRVMELTRFNGDIIAGFEARGYLVEELADDDTTPCGLYFGETQQRVTDESAMAYSDPEAPDRRLVLLKPEEIDPAKWHGMPKDERRRRRVGSVPRGQTVADAIGAKIQRSSLQAQLEEAAAINKIGKTRKA